MTICLLIIAKKVIKYVWPTGQTQPRKFWNLGLTPRFFLFMLTYSHGFVRGILGLNATIDDLAVGNHVARQFVDAPTKYIPCSIQVPVVDPPALRVVYNLPVG